MPALMRIADRLGVREELRRMSSDLQCGVCASLAAGVIHQNDLWCVRPIEAPAGVPGWMLLVARRHVAGPAYFNDAEAASFGPTLRHCERILERVTGALRIYTAALGELYPHFHAHMVPRYSQMPLDAAGWSVFELQRAAREGTIAVDAAGVARIVAAYKEALEREPLPVIGA